VTITATSPHTSMPFRIPRDPLGAEFERLLSEGLARVVVADVLVARGVPDSSEIRSAAVGLLLGQASWTARPGWAVGFDSAAWLHSGIPRDGRPAPGALQVIVPRGRRRPLSPWLRCRQVPLAPEEITWTGAVPVTDPLRTAADIARDRPGPGTLEVLRRLGELCDVRPQDVREQLSSMSRARGVAQARRLIREWELEP
jgi:hypothetical protein